MKKLKYIALLILISLLLCSCINQLTPKENNKAYLSVELAANKERTVYPVVDVDSFTNIILMGAKEGGDFNNLLQAATAAELATQTIELDPGKWDFMLSARLNGVAFYGAVNDKTINSGANTISFALESKAEKGKISITYNFSGDANTVYASLFDTRSSSQISSPWGQPVQVPLIQKTFTSENFLTSNNGKSFIFEEEIERGTYKLVIDFYHGDAKLNSASLYARVESGLTSSSTIDLDLNDFYTVTYHDNGGILAAGEIKIENYSKYTDDLSLPSMDKENCDFIGWYTTSDFQEGTDVTSIPVGVTELWAKFICYEVTVSSSGTHEGGELGSGLPVDSIQTAITQIVAASQSDNAYGKNWTIYIDGTVTGAQYVGTYDLTNDLILPLTVGNSYSNRGPRSITIIGKHEPDANGSPVDVLDGGSPTDTDVTVLRINTKYYNTNDSYVPVTVKNLKITGGRKGTTTTIYSNTGSSGPGIYVGGYSNSEKSLRYASATKVALDNVLVTDNTTENYGGGLFIFANSTVIMKAGTVITNNTAADGGGVYQFPWSDFYMKSGTEIKNNNGNGVGSLGGTFHMQGGTISGNITSGQTGKGYFGSNYDSGSEATVKMYISGDAKFGDDNDLPLSSSIYLGGALTSEKVAKRYYTGQNFTHNSKNIIYLPYEQDEDENGTQITGTSIDAEHEKFEIIVTENNGHSIPTDTSECTMWFTEEGWLEYGKVIGPIYVQQTGVDDTGNGSIDNPYKSLNYAISTTYNSIADSDRTDYDFYDVRVIGTLEEGQSIPDTIKKGHCLAISGSHVLNSTGVPQDCIDAKENDRALKIESKIPTTLRKLKITGGKTTGNGGGIYAYTWYNPGNGSTVDHNLVFGTGLLITGNECSGNRGGAGVFIDYGTYLYMNDGVSITNNQANCKEDETGGFGGGVYAWTSSSINILGGSINNNNAEKYGGGLFLAGSGYMYGGTISGNTAVKGGAYYKYNGDGSLKNGDNSITDSGSWYKSTTEGTISNNTSTGGSETTGGID